MRAVDQHIRHQMRRVPTVTALVVGAALLLAGCSSRDAVLAEQVSAANDAAARAELAAKRAEYFANHTEKAAAPAPAEADAEDPAPDAEVSDPAAAENADTPQA